MGNFANGFNDTTAAYRGYDIFATAKVAGRLDGDAEKIIAGGNNLEKSYEGRELPKHCFEIMDATVDAVVEILLGNNNFFDGIDTGQMQSVLDKYFITAQTRMNDTNSNKNDNGTYIYEVATETDKDKKYPNAKKVREAYQKMTNFLKVFDVDYRDAKIDDIAAAIGTDKPSAPTGDKPTETEINAARDAVVSASQNDNEFKDKLKAIFEDNRSELLNQDKKVLEELKKLAIIIGRAYKNGNE
ncbi:1527_t:CDS:2, partial [Ambispora leptoticha]